MERLPVPRTLATQGHVFGLRVGDQPLTDALRDAALEALRAGRSAIKAELDAIVFLQRATPNRNHLRFEDKLLPALAASFVDAPFLRDHEQGDVRARGGTVKASELVVHEGHPAIRQQIELAAPWAAELALRGLLDRFSIGWHSGPGDAVCSACREPFEAGFFGRYPTCDHSPGDKLKDGSVVEILFTAAEGVEVSGVSVPAVPGTGVHEIRAALAAQRAESKRSRPIEVQSDDPDTFVRGLLLAAKENPMSLKLLLASALSLAEDVTEAAIVAEVKAQAATLKASEARVAELEAAQAEQLKAAKAAKLSVLLDECRRKFGQTLGADGKPIAGGTDHEAALLGLAEISIERAEAWLAKQKPMLKVGGRPQSASADPNPKPASGSLAVPPMVRAGLRRQGWTDEQIDKEYARRDARQAAAGESAGEED